MSLLWQMMALSVARSLCQTFCALMTAGNGSSTSRLTNKHIKPLTAVIARNCRATNRAVPYPANPHNT
jgi:Mn2+/Fe2+ NRAMP family transporter